MLAAIILGAALAYLGQNISFLRWLAWGKSLGVNDISVDLYVISFSLLLNIRFTISQLITIPIGLIVYAKTCKGL
jgi:hypothetical protein